MKPDEFEDKLHVAAVCHNMGVIHRRSGKANEAIQSFEDCLDIYNECIVYYNHLSECTTHKVTSANVGGGASTVKGGSHSSSSSTNHPEEELVDERQHQSQRIQQSNQLPLQHSPKQQRPQTPTTSKHNQSDTATTTPTRIATSKSSSTPICLELKIAQTLQSMARLYSKTFNDTDSAIKAHEDAINFLVHGKFILDDVEDAEESYWKHCSGNAMMGSSSSISGSGNILYDTPQRQERISKHHNLYDEYDKLISPTSVIMNGRTRDENFNNDDFRFPSLDEYNVVKLTDHERTRVITTSLNALARIYTTHEIEECERRQRRMDKTRMDNKNHEEFSDDDNEDEEEERFIEDPLQYYEQVLSHLYQFENNFSSETLIRALSNDNKTITTASDAALTVTKLSTPMIIDLRKDIGSTLMQMGALHMQREHYTLAVDVFEQAKNIRCDLCNNGHTTDFEIIDDEYIESVYSLGLSYQKLELFDKALPCFQSVMKTKKQRCGPESMEVANLYCNMSNILRQTGNMAESLSYIKRAIAVYKKNRECLQEHEQMNYHNSVVEVELNQHRTICKCVMGALKNCASLYMQMEEVSMAIEAYLEIMEIQKQMELEDHPDFATTMNILGDLYFTNDELEKAKTAFGHALRMYREFGLGENDPDFIMTMKSIDEIEVNINSRLKPKDVESSPSEKRSSNTMKKLRQSKQKSPKSPKKSKDLKPNKINLDSGSESGFEIFTSSDTDDIVSNITFSNKFKATEYVYEGVLNMTKAMVEDVANAAEEFLSGTPVTPKKNCQSFPSQAQLSVIDENIEQVLCDDGKNVVAFHNVQRTDDDLSDLLGSFATEVSFKSSDHSEKNMVPKPKGSIANSMKSEYHAKNAIIQPPSEVNSVHDDVSTLLGTSFLNSASVKDESSLFGATFVNSVCTAPKNSSQSQFFNAANKSTSLAMNESYSNIDDLLAQMNVVSNDTDGEGNAKPFKDILQLESSDFDSSPDFTMNRRKNFEKLSSCLDTLEELEEKYGYGHIKCLDTLQTLADIYINNGDKAKGINTLMTVVHVQRKKYGENHIEVADTHMIIAKLCIELKDYSKAIDSYTKVKEVEEFLFGNTDPKIALTLNKIGEMELQRGDFDLAMDKFQEALRIQRIYLAPNEINPDLSQTLVNIGSVYYKERNSFNKIKHGNDTYKSFIESGMLGKIAFAHSERGEYVKATHFYGELLELLNNSGQSNHGVVSTLNHLGALSLKLGRYVAAMAYHQEALDIAKNLEDARELEICEGKVNIGVVEYKLGNFSRAIEIIEKEYSTMQSLIGKDHYRVAKVEFHLGVIRRILCQYEKALLHLESAHSIQLGFLQEHHSDTMATQLEIGITKLELHNLDAALEQFNPLLQNQLDVLGKVHPDVALTHYYIGACYAKNGDTKKASRNLRRSYRMSHDLHADETPDATGLLETPQLAKLLEAIGYIHISKEKYDRAAIVFNQSIRVRRDCFGEDHYEIAYGMLNLGVLFTEKLEFQQAMLCFNEAMSIAVKTFGLQHPLIADIHLNVGKVQLRKCHFDEAKQEISFAIKIYKLSLSSSHEKIVSAMKCLERVIHEEELCV